MSLCNYIDSLLAIKSAQNSEQIANLPIVEIIGNI